MVEDEKVLQKPDITIQKNYRWDGEVDYAALLDTPETTDIEGISEGTEAEIKQRRIMTERQAAADVITETGVVITELVNEYFSPDIITPIEDLIEEITIVIGDVRDNEPPLDPEPEVLPEILPPISNENWVPDSEVSPEIVAAIRSGAFESLVSNTIEYPVAVHSWPSFSATARDVLTQELIDVKELFMTDLRFLMTAFMNELLQLRKEVGFHKLDDVLKHFDGDAVKVTDPQLFPLRDLIIRSQIERNQKARLFRKTHSIDQTIYHLRATKAANEQWARSLEAKIGLGDSMVDAAMDEMILKTRDEYHQRYRQSMYGLSKYLNGATPVLGSMLSAMAMEAKAKGKLLKSGVNIYETKDTAALSSNTKTEAAKTPAAADGKTPAGSTTTSVLPGGAAAGKESTMATPTTATTLNGNAVTGKASTVAIPTTTKTLNGNKVTDTAITTARKAASSYRPTKSLW